jgi:hypothetical protein
MGCELAFLYCFWHFLRAGAANLAFWFHMQLYFCAKKHAMILFSLFVANLEYNSHPVATLTFTSFAKFVVNVWT